MLMERGVAVPTGRITIVSEHNLFYYPYPSFASA